MKSLEICPILCVMFWNPKDFSQSFSPGARQCWENSVLAKEFWENHIHQKFGMIWMDGRDLNYNQLFCCAPYPTIVISMWIHSPLQGFSPCLRSWLPWSNQGSAPSQGDIWKKPREPREPGDAGCRLLSCLGQVGCFVKVQSKLPDWLQDVDFFWYGDVPRLMLRNYCNFIFRASC